MRVYTSYEVPEYNESGLDKMAQLTFNYMAQYQKYRTMWQLRSLESEIDADGGMIIINDNGRVHIKDFHSQELVDKIKAILTANKD